MCGIAEQVGERFVDLLAGRHAGALIKLAMKHHVELEKVEPLHVQPLVYEPRDELI